MNQTKAKLMEATMDIIAEVGLDGFSMKQVTDRVGVTTAVVYQYFGTKDELLYQCFMSVNRNISELFVDCRLPEDPSDAELVHFVHDLWVRYFNFLLESGKKTLFYFAYRESTYLDRILMRNNEAVAADMQYFMEVFRVFADHFGLAQKLDMDYFWVYFLDGTGNFAKRVISRNIPIESVQVEKIWQLLMGGLAGLLN